MDLTKSHDIKVGSMSSVNLESGLFSRPVLFPGYDTPHHLEALVRKKLEGPRESKPVKLRVGMG